MARPHRRRAGHHHQAAASRVYLPVDDPLGTARRVLGPPAVLPKQSPRAHGPRQAGGSWRAVLRRAGGELAQRDREDPGHCAALGDRLPGDAGTRHRGRGCLGGHQRRGHHPGLLTGGQVSTGGQASATAADCQQPLWMMAVENAASCGQHGLVQWTSCGRLKNLENSRQTLLCSGPWRLYNFSTSENGYHSETTSGVLGETPGSLEEAQGALGTLRGTEATSGQQENSEDLGGNPEEPRSSSGWAGRPVLPGFRQVSWTGGRTHRVWLADCPGSQLAGAIGGVSLLRPGGAPASHTCGGLVFLRAAGQYAVVRVA